jgi:signal transduction histidine kinase
LTVTAFTALVVRLIRLSRFLRKVALRTGQELATTRSHLSEVQLYLHSAQFQQSLFEMVAGLSHELNTPLGNCLSASSYLESRISEIQTAFEQGSLSKEGFCRAVQDSGEGFSIMRENLERMKIQIETFKRLSGVNLETQGSVIPLDRFVDEELPRLMREWGGSVEYDVLWDRLGKAEVRYTDLEIILQQLLDNCREHAEATRATVAFRVHEGLLDISFSDNGKGISDEALEKIAEPFFTTARGKNHMGLGLSILSSFVINNCRARSASITATQDCG